MKTISPVYLSPSVQAEALAAALVKLGFTTEVLKSRDYLHHPCVVITCGRKRHLRQTEYVYAAPELGGDSGFWWFWRASPTDPIDMTQVSPIGEISVAADLLMRAITRFQE